LRPRGPTGLWLEPSGSLLCAFSDDHTIYRIHGDGRMQLLLGIPPNRPYDFDSCQKRVSEDELSTMPLWGPTSIIAQPDGTLYFIERGYQNVREYIPGQGMRTLFPPELSPQFQAVARTPASGRLDAHHPGFPTHIAFDAQGRLHVADARQRSVIRVDVAAGTFTRILESSPVSSSRGGPSAIAFGPDGTAWVDEHHQDLRGCAVPSDGPWEPVTQPGPSWAWNIKSAGAGILCTA
jgi:hypothetical protein